MRITHNNFDAEYRNQPTKTTHIYINVKLTAGA